MIHNTLLWMTKRLCYVSAPLRNGRWPTCSAWMKQNKSHGSVGAGDEKSSMIFTLSWSKGFRKCSGYLYKTHTQSHTHEYFVLKGKKPSLFILAVSSNNHRQQISHHNMQCAILRFSRQWKLCHLLLVTMIAGCVASSQRQFIRTGAKAMMKE